MKNLLKALLPLLLCLCLLISCTGTVQPSSVDEPAVESETEPAPTAAELYEPFEPVLRFVVCSDVHIGISMDCVEAARFTDLINSSYAYADAQESYKALDALVLVGDLTTDGEVNAYRNIKTILNDNLREETQFISMLGNHEHYGNAKAFSFVLNQQNNSHNVINGYHFIAVSPDIPSNEYSDDVVSWLNTELAAAAADAPDKPIFTFQHHHLHDSVYVSNDWGTSSTPGLRSAYGAYPQVINFSGHSHGPINHPRTVWQDDFTMIGTGTLSYFSMEEDGVCNRTPYEEAAQFSIVEVNADNVVKVMPYNLRTGDFMKTPSNTDDADTQLVYYIPITGSKDDFVYTAAQYDTASAPYFAENAVITVSDVTANGATVSVPQAYDDSCVYCYTFAYADAAGNGGSIVLSSEYCHEPLCESIGYAIPDLTPATEYTVTVTPVNVWKVEGTPITVTFTTAAE